MRTCKRCSTEKELSEFPKHKNKPLGAGHTCRKCSNEIIKASGRTKNGVVGAIWQGQLHSCRYRKMNAPTYSKAELSSWILEQALFHSLYSKWVSSGYLKKLKPSVDRLNDYKSYSMDNIQLMTFGENQDKSHRDKINGINTKQCKAVVATVKGTDKSAVYYSIAEASRVLGVDSKNINYCCQNKPKYKSAGGYTWKYLEEASAH